MLAKISTLLSVVKYVTLINDQGFMIYVDSIAAGNIGIYTTDGEFYSSCRLTIQHYRILNK